MHFKIIIAVLVSCFAGYGAEKGAGSVEELVKVVRVSFEKRYPEMLLRHFYVKGSPAEVSAAITNSIRTIWGEGKWTATTVEAVRFAEYQSTTGVPGAFNGKKLEWLAPPTHWIVLKAEAPKDEAAKGNMKVEFAVAEREKEWWLLGVKYVE
jgi:hypothetical protein